MKLAHMPKPKPNPLYLKKPGETAAQHMSRLRKEFPKKFGMQKGYKVGKRFTLDQVKEMEKRAAEKAVAELKAATAKQVSEVSAAEAPPAANAETKPAAAAPVAVPPVPSPSQAPPDVPAATLNLGSSPALPDTQIFGASTPPPPKVDATSPDAPPLPPPEPPAGTPGAPSPTSAPGPVTEADGGKYGAMIWAMIVRLCVGIFGPGFEPMCIKDAAGKVIYDEGAEGTKVWVNYLASIGVKVFSPVVELWIFMGSYVGMRTGLVIARFRRKKTAAQPSPPTGTEAPRSPTEKSTSPGDKSPPPPPPAGPPATPPPPPSAAPAIGEVDLGDEP